MALCSHLIAEIISESDEEEIYGSSGIQAEGIDERRGVNGLYEVAFTLLSDVLSVHFLFL